MTFASRKEFGELMEKLTLFTMGLFGAAQVWWEETPLLKVCRTYRKRIKIRTVIPYLKKIQKIHESDGTSLELCRHQFFFTGNQTILLYQKMKKHGSRGGRVGVLFQTWEKVILDFQSLLIETNRKVDITVNKNVFCF